MSVYKQKQHKSDYNSQINYILHNYVMAMKGIRRFIRCAGRKRYWSQIYWDP